MAEENQANPAEAAQAAQGPQFSIQRTTCVQIQLNFRFPLFLKNRRRIWRFKRNVFGVNALIEENVYEIVLAVTVTAMLGEETAFLCEVQQAGIFAIGEMPEQNKAHMLGSFCPNTLFPYARETISNLVNRGTFPPLNLAPVNFDAIFAAYMQKRAAQQAQEQAPTQLDA